MKMTFNPKFLFFVMICVLFGCGKPDKYVGSKQIINEIAAELSSEYLPPYDGNNYELDKSLVLYGDSIIIEKWIYDYEVRVYVIKFIDGEILGLPFPKHDFVDFWQYEKLCDSSNVVDKTFAAYYYTIQKITSQKFTARKAERLFGEIMISLENAKTVYDSTDIIKHWGYTNSQLFSQTPEAVCKERQKTITSSVLSNIYIKDYFTIINAFAVRGIIIQLPFIDNSDFKKGTGIKVYRSECFHPAIDAIEL